MISGCLNTGPLTGYTGTKPSKLMINDCHGPDLTLADRDGISDTRAPTADLTPSPPELFKHY